jgi:hypothetical protein
VFEHLPTGREVCVLNTHLDHQSVRLAIQALSLSARPDAQVPTSAPYFFRVVRVRTAHE